MRVKRVRVKVNSDAIKKIVTSSEVHSKVEELADGVAERARNIAHAEAYETGDYMRGIVTRDPGTPDGKVEVAATDWKSGFLEARVHTLARAAAESGGRAT